MLLRVRVFVRSLFIKKSSVDQRYNQILYRRCIEINRYRQKIELPVTSYEYGASYNLCKRFITINF